MEAAGEVLRLFLGSVLYRPYVYIFFLCFCAFAWRHMGMKRTVLYTVIAWIIAYLAEFSSTRNGFPFGFYHYIDTTRNRELWLSNVPFWDSLSFVFLSYFSFMLASALTSSGHDLTQSPWPGMKNPRTPVLGGILMMLLDVVIDPVALQGHKWFLGQIYWYPEPGFYFGVTAANFFGWFFVGFVTQWVFQKLLLRGKWRSLPRFFVWGVFLVYAGVFGFNLFMTFWIQDHALAKASTTVSVGTLAVIGYLLKRTSAESQEQAASCVS